MIGFWMAAVLLAAPPAQPASTASDACVACHEKRSPGVVADWKLSRHSQVAVGCDTCHGSAHKTDDASLARLPPPTPATSATPPRSTSSRRASTPRPGRP